MSNANSDETSSYELQAVRIEGPKGTIFESLDMEIPARGITVLMGPAGTGKSVLLRALAGERCAEGFEIGGSIRYRGAPVTQGERPEGVLWCPQRVAHRFAGERPGPTLLEALASPEARTILTDEPNMRASAEEIEQMVAGLKAHAERGSAIVVTHDQRFAQRLADHARLLVAGELEASCGAKEFFEAPPTARVERFLKQGNVWLEGPRAPELPSHFHWILPEKMAGMGQPGLLREPEQDLEAIAAAGITLLVSLTETRHPVEQLSSVGIAGHHLPTKDMGIPSISNASRVCALAKRTMERGGAVA
ncbi:MAG: ATP-binding cassette domain-containing protein, partial [Myxococcales bacterium]|nr:ATP-binding cassette domain-containing protein [Myxococcales bacterium]